MRNSDRLRSTSLSTTAVRASPAPPPLISLRREEAASVCAMIALDWAEVAAEVNACRSCGDLGAVHLDTDLGRALFGRRRARLECLRARRRQLCDLRLHCHVLFLELMEGFDGIHGLHAPEHVGGGRAAGTVRKNRAICTDPCTRCGSADACSSCVRAGSPGTTCESVGSLRREKLGRAGGQAREAAGMDHPDRRSADGANRHAATGGWAHLGLRREKLLHSCPCLTTGLKRCAQVSRKKDSPFR